MARYREIYELERLGTNIKIFRKIFLAFFFKDIMFHEKIVNTIIFGIVNTSRSFVSETYQNKSKRCLLCLSACNVLSFSTTDPFTLRNYGRRINCTFMALYPGAVEVFALGVGGSSSHGVAHMTETGTLRKVHMYVHDQFSNSENSQCINLAASTVI